MPPIPGDTDPSATVPAENALASTTGEPMLWPTSFVGDYIADTLFVRYGFITSDGRRITEQYFSFDFCKDSEGVPTSVAVSTEDHIELLDLNGNVTKQIPNKPAASLRCYLDRYIVNVEFSEGMVLDYFIYDLANNQEITLPDWMLTANSGEVVDYLQPENFDAFLNTFYTASDLIPWYDESEKYGYRKLSDGSWLRPPSYDQASSFSDGKALVNIDEEYFIIDEEFSPASESYAGAVEIIVTIPSSWMLKRADDSFAFFSSEYKQLTPWNDSGEGLVSDEWGWASGSNEVFNVKTKKWLTVPDGFIPYLKGFAVRRDLTQAYSYLTENIFNIPAGLGISAEQYLAPRHLLGCVNNRGDIVLLTAAGKPLGSNAVASWEGSQAAAGIYYWAVIGSYRGLLNVGGQWLYKEIRFDRLED